MILNVLKNTVLLFVLILISCGSNVEKKSAKDSEILNRIQGDKNIVVGANQIEKYLPLLNGKKVGIVANQTSVIFKDKRRKTEDQSFTHLVDSLLSLNVDIKTVFAPEHGFRGTADAGEHVTDGIDTKTGLPIISLYGKNRKPSQEQLKDIDIMIFDIQDVGARFYTYISSLHYVMEACAELGIPLLILDRPNPNGHYIDGPVLEQEYKSFVGMHPIPIVHGMTIGEYAQMINGESWLTNGIQCKLTVIPIKNYTHKITYNMPIKPSPNLPNDKAINLYPSLCLFEGTTISVGRGTNTQFQIFGSPFLNPSIYTFQFTPQPNEGAKYPKYKGELCYGRDLRAMTDLNFINLDWLIEAYNNTENKNAFFNTFFIKLVGTKKLQQQIEAGLNETEIKATWEAGLDVFKKIRSKYLIYD
ncbi:MAG: DUF1343 domain-containing protein [Chlorobi bacterium]|nr:DUF1343 domain-containing protein [Chlorobiota bacterium]